MLILGACAKTSPDNEPSSDTDCERDRPAVANDGFPVLGSWILTVLANDVLDFFRVHKLVVNSGDLRRVGEDQVSAGFTRAIYHEIDAIRVDPRSRKVNPIAAVQFSNDLPELPQIDKSVRFILTPGNG